MDIRDKSSVIKEIQERLYYFYKQGYDIPIVFPDGIYGEKTKNAVRAFRAIRFLEDSDIADLELWRELYK